MSRDYHRTGLSRTTTELQQLNIIIISIIISSLECLSLIVLCSVMIYLSCLVFTSSLECLSVIMLPLCHDL
jgi:hypothetical protein